MHADSGSCVMTVTSLLTALLVGLPHLTQTELNAACGDVLRMTCGTNDEAAAQLLQDKLRSAIA